jgi:hypothetical protein
LPPVAEPSPTPARLARPPRLPATILADIEAKAAEVAAAGRTMTAADVLAVAKLPQGLADQAARYFAAAPATS